MANDKSMRITFELERPDNPPLFDELSRFPKGTRRVNRLRTLAHEGLMKQETAARSMDAHRASISIMQEPTDQSTVMQASHELFGASIQE